MPSSQASSPTSSYPILPSSQEGSPSTREQSSPPSQTVAQTAPTSPPAPSVQFRRSAYLSRHCTPPRNASHSSHSSHSQSRLDQGDSTSSATVFTTRRPRAAHGAIQASGDSMCIPVPTFPLASDPHDHDSDSKMDNLNPDMPGSGDNASSSALETVATCRASGISVSSVETPILSSVPARDHGATASRPESPYPSEHGTWIPTALKTGNSRSAVFSGGDVERRRRSGSDNFVSRYSRSPLMPSPPPLASGNSGVHSFYNEDKSISPVSRSGDASPSTQSVSLPLKSSLPDCNTLRSSGEQHSSTSSSASSGSSPNPINSLMKRRAAVEKYEHYKRLKSKIQNIQKVFRKLNTKILLTCKNITELRRMRKEAITNDDPRTVIKTNMSINTLKRLVTESRCHQEKVYQLLKSLRVEMLSSVLQ